MLAAHYAPAARVMIVSSASVAAVSIAEQHRGATVGLLAAADVATPTSVVRLAGPDPFDGERVARSLYALLRAADRAALDVLLVIPPSGDDRLFAAVRDRLRRAAAVADPLDPH